MINITQKTLLSFGLASSLLISSQGLQAQQPTPASAQIATQASQPASKKLNLSPIFINLSDAMAAIKANDASKAKGTLLQIQTAFDAIDATAKNSTLGQQTSQAIGQAISNPTEANLSAVSNALYAFEKEQNPVDYSTKRKEFAKKMVPAYDNLNQVIQRAAPTDVEALRAAYNQFNAVWLGNERVVRNTSMGHYGKIETPMALMRVAIETQPINMAQIKTQSAALKDAIDSYNKGDVAAVQTTQTVTLADSIQLLRDGLQAFKTNDAATGQAKLGEFISIWPTVEGDVRTRNPSLYNRVESQIPLVMAKGQDPKQQQTLQSIINELAAINPTAQYTAVDSMLILLREGLEALLIVISLLSALTAAKQVKAKKWVYAGVAFGLLASIAGAMALQLLFPAVTSAANREMFEGVIGIVAVIMMIGIGAWLHSKSSVQSWNAYIKRHMGQAMTAGSFASLFGLSFLSVFREGAETILFYVGILPNISMSNFLTGIGLAVVALAAVAWVMLRTSVKLPIPQLFKLLTWVIYLLGFKILGVSLHALQLTGYLPMTAMSRLPAIESLGFYPTLQTFLAQIGYIVILIAINLWMKNHQRQQTAALA